MSDNTDKSGGLMPGQLRDVPTKVAGPSGNTYLSPFPARDPLSWREFVESQPQPDPAQVAAAQELAQRQRIEAAKAAEQRARAEVEAYSREVEGAAKAAAALKPGPLAPLGIRRQARSLIHGIGAQPPWGTGNTDAILERLKLLRDRGEYLYEHLKGLDETGRAVLDIAENTAYRAFMDRARVVAGEVIT